MRKSGFFNYFLKSYRVTFLIIVGLAALGIFTVLTLPRESTPEIEIPFAAVVTVYPGAAARDVEELVTTPIEDELLALEGLEQLSSSSSLGVSSIGVEFSADEDLDEALQRLREKVDQIRNLPAEAGLPQVIELNFSDEPILSIGLGGIDDERLLAVLADELAGELEQIPGVSQVDVVGATEEEIKVVIDPARLADQGLTLGQVLGAIRSANINAPFGQLETERFNYDLRVVGRFTDVSDVADIPIVRPDGVVVRLGTLANVSLALTERDTLSRISVEGADSTPAISLQVRKQAGGNIIRIVDAVEERLEEMGRTHLRQGFGGQGEIQVVTFADRADEIRQSLSNVARSGAQTLVIVFGLLWLFLGWRPAIIASLAVPLTFSMSFLVFDLTGTTLNGISLFSLILSLGLLVDTTIVIVEGICSGGVKTNLTEHAAEVVDRFKKPLMGGTLTTVAAFFPMLLMTGIIGQFLKVIPTVVTATLISSLFVALAFIPPVAVRMMLRMSREGFSRKRWFDQIFSRFRSRYMSFISWALGSRGFQRAFIGILTVLLIAGLSLPFTGLLKTGLFPAVDIDFMIINIELPPGSQLEQTDKVLKKVEVMLHEVPEVESYVANGGSGVSLGFGGGSGGGGGNEALGSFFINLDKERERTSLDITDELRDKFAAITEAKVVAEEISAGPPTAPPVELKVIGDDLAEIDRVSQEVMDELAKIPGAIDIDRNLRNSAGEFNFVFDREALAATGLSTADVTQLLRASVFGLEATSFLDEAGDEIAVRVEAVEETINSIDDVLAIPILTPTGQRVTLGQLATVNLSSSLSTIRHNDGDRAVTVTANADEGTTPNEISEEIMRRIEKIGLPASVQVDFGGEQEETLETFQQLYRSMVIAVILILLILVVEFNSYRQPLIIFLSIPLALIGVLFGLLILGGQLNFASFIGLVSLTGIVVNNAIILVDRMNRMRAAGRSIIEAVKEASDSRLRPIILTTFTTAAGVAPLIWVDEFFRDMALTLITGLLFSSIITLVLIPILYLRQAQKMERKRLRRAALA